MRRSARRNRAKRKRRALRKEIEGREILRALSPRTVSDAFDEELAELRALLELACGC